ncbi:MAG: hypothetical protein V4751_13860 [Pseudomonadota bacterium]
MYTLPVTKKRFIAYFDIMGFKDFIYRNSHRKVSKIMDEIAKVVSDIKDYESEILKTPIEERNQKGLKGKVVLPVIFSDSIIFISESDTRYDLHKILLVSSFFLGNSIGRSIPVKGAISHGLFTADFEKSKFFGQPLIDAFLLAEEAQFYGVIVHNTVEARFNKRGTPMHGDLIKRGLVPMKSGKVTHYFSLWEGVLGEKYGSKDAMKKLIEKFYSTSSGNVRRYVDNSIEIYAGDS